MTKIKFDAKAIANYYKNKSADAITKGLDIMEVELKRLTPEDTEEMLHSYKKISVQKQGDTVEGGVTNTSDHALKVEVGEGVVYDYHKPSNPNKRARPVIYRGVGNRTFKRSTENKRKEITDLIFSHIDS